MRMECSLYLALFSLVLGLNYGQLIVPKRPLGYVFSGSRDAPVHLHVHMDPLCSDSAKVFPIVKQVASHYGASHFILVIHMFPLPYHHQAFLVAKGAQIVKEYGIGDTTAYIWFQYFFDNIDKFSSKNTANKTTSDIIGELADVAVTLGVERNVFLHGMTEWDMESNTRAAWKYSCTRGIASTPTFLLNDIIVNAWTWTLNDWKQNIDPMMVGLNGTGISSAVSLKTGDCPADTVKCTYLPNKTQCCNKGESCIPDVGCRCPQPGC